MLTKILGAFDIFVAVILFLIVLKIAMPFQLLLVIIIILAIKSIPFFISFCLASMIDLIVVIFLIINFFFNLPVFLFLFAALAIAQKGVFSLL